MSKQHQISYGLNIGLHVFILFTFLTVFFFAFISKLSRKSIEKSLGSIINKQVDSMLTEFDVINMHRGVNGINWSEVNKMAKKIENESQGVLPMIRKNNAKLKLVSAVIIITMAILLTGSFIYYKVVKGYNIGIKHILTENLVIFAFIGLIEYMFFTRIASKYIPVTPDFVATTILERIKYNLSHEFIQ